MFAAISLFVLTYTLLLLLPKYRAHVAVAAAAVFALLCGMSLSAILKAVDWNVLLMIGGTMGIVALFVESGMPSFLADKILKKTPDVRWAVVALAAFAGVISAFIDNVATVLIIAPVALDISKKLGISPKNSIIAIALSSNLQGAATLVGDTTSILLGGYAGLDFLDFFFLRGKPGLFWTVQLSALAASAVLLWLFRKDKQKISVPRTASVTSYFPGALLLGMIILLIAASFLPHRVMAGGSDVTNGVICVSLFAAGLIRQALQKKDLSALLPVIRKIDFFTLALLGGLFVVIAGLTASGAVEAVSNVFLTISGGNLFAVYTIFVWVSVFLSGFIDNIPYVAAMMPVVRGIAAAMGIEPLLLYFGLLTGATLGGNLTPIGASANIAALGILKKEGHTVKTSEFIKIGLPFTLAAVSVGYLIIWLLWA